MLDVPSTWKSSSLAPQNVTTRNGNRALSTRLAAVPLMRCLSSPGPSPRSPDAGQTSGGNCRKN